MTVQTLLDVKFTLTLVVLLPFSLFSLLHKLLQRGLALISLGQGDTYGAVNL